MNYLSMKFFFCFCFSFSLFATDSGDRVGKIQKILEQARFSGDIKAELQEIIEKDIDKLEYHEIPDILNKVRVKNSRFYGCILAVHVEELTTLEGPDQELLNAYYGEDKEKLQKAINYWWWHARPLGGIGLPTHWSVGTKKVACVLVPLLIGGCYYCLRGTQISFSF
jgi:hypothetical protein